MPHTLLIVDALDTYYIFISIMSIILLVTFHSLLIDIAKGLFALAVVAVLVWLKWQALKGHHDRSLGNGDIQTLFHGKRQAVAA